MLFVCLFGEGCGVCHCNVDRKLLTCSFWLRDWYLGNWSTKSSSLLRYCVCWHRDWETAETCQCSDTVDCSAPICCCISHRLLWTRERRASCCVVAAVRRRLLRLCFIDVSICCTVMFKFFTAGVRAYTSAEIRFPVCTILVLIPIVDGTWTLWLVLLTWMVVSG